MRPRRRPTKREVQFVIAASTLQRQQQRCSPWASVGGDRSPRRMSADDHLSTSSFESTDSGGRPKKNRNKVTFSDCTDTRTYVPAAPLLDGSDVVAVNVDLATPVGQRSAVLLTTAASIVKFANDESPSPPGQDSTYVPGHSRSPRVYRPVPPPPAEEKPVSPLLEPSRTTLPYPSISADSRSIARDACIANDYVRLREVLRSIDAGRLKSALLQRLEEGNARLVVALSLLLPRQSFPSRSRHCVKCHENYEDVNVIEAGQVGLTKGKLTQTITAWDEAGSGRSLDRLASGSNVGSSPHQTATCEHESSVEAALLAVGSRRSCFEAGCVTRFV